MMINVRWFLPAVAAVLVAAACAPTAQPSPEQPKPPAAQPKQPAAPADPEQLWEEMAEAAGAEGRVIVQTSSAELREFLGPVFRDRFGVDVEVIVGRGAEITARLDTERAGGVYSTDVVVTGLTSIANVMYEGGWLTPIKSMVVHPDALDPSAWRGGEVPYQDPDRQYVVRAVETVQNLITYNPEFIDGSAVIQVADDLLKPELRGQMSTDDPTAPGSGQQTALYFLHFKDEDFLRRLYIDQEPAVALDQRQVADWFARGVHPIMLTPREENVVRLIEDGFQVRTVWPSDVPPMVGTGGSFIAALDQGPNPNATKLFLNWILTQEGQQLFSELRGTVSVRTDVEPVGVPEWSIPQPGVEYFSIDDWEFRTVGFEERQERIRELVGR